MASISFGKWKPSVGSLMRVLGASSSCRLRQFLRRSLNGRSSPSSYALSMTEACRKSLGGSVPESFGPALYNGYLTDFPDGDAYRNLHCRRSAQASETTFWSTAFTMKP